MRFLPFLPFRRARSQQVAMLGALSVLAAFGGWGCPSVSSPIKSTAISGTEFAYVTNRADNTVSAYTVDSVAGTLKPIGTTSVGKSPSKTVSVSLGTKSNYVYVLNQQDKTISQFAVNADGTLAPLNPATVSTGNAPTDMALSADGQKFSGSYSGGITQDNREFRVYVTTQTGALNVYGINADGRLALKNQLQGQGYPVAVGTTGPDYALYEGTSRYAPHDLDGGMAILDQSNNVVRLYSFAPLANGGLKQGSPPTLPATAPLSVSGTTRNLQVGLTHDAINTYAQFLDTPDTPTYDKTVHNVDSSAVSMTSLAMYATVEDQGLITTQTYEYAYAATADGAVYRIEDNTPELKFTPTQPLFLKGYRGRLYVVKQNDNMVTSYAPHFGNAAGPTGLPNVEADTNNGTLQADSAKSAATGHAPTSITFLNTNPNGGAVQTTLR